MPKKTESSEQYISAHGVRVNNLKNVNVEIPLDSLTVITGLSGSGKSSLAFDTLYAEGQRRYVESLSAYARQFLGKMAKPECDWIRGLPPAIAIEQKVNTRNPRSTVGTSTEIYDYIRLLFGRIGRTISPKSGQEVKKHTVNDLVNRMTSLPEGSRITLSSPIMLPERRTVSSQIDIFRKEGFTRLIDSNGHFINLDDLPSDIQSLDNYELLIDRMSSSSAADEVSRFSEGVETAFFEGHGHASLWIWESDGNVHKEDFSTVFEADGMTFIEPSEAMFNFNNPYGACPRCEGFGKTVGIDERLVVPDPSHSVFEDAVVCWRGEKMSQWKTEFIRRAAPLGFPVHTPYAELEDKWRDLLWHGDHNKGIEGIDDFFEMVASNQYKIQYRVMQARYRGKTLCPVCHGTRLRKDASYVQVAGHTITDIVRMPVVELRRFFDSLVLQNNDMRIAGRLLVEIQNRLRFLDDVGLGYLTLDRPSSTLSGGESQRINLATSLGSSLIGSLYILDEPSIGLHSRDTDRLLSVLKRLRDIGNTVVIVEHDEDIIRAADYIIDVGPDAGRLGGEIVYQGPAAKLTSAAGHTADYISGRANIPVPSSRRPWRDSIKLNGVREHNLKNIDVEFPLGVMTVVTGVSGSGKSTLVRDVLYRALARRLDIPADAPGLHTSISGQIDRIEDVEFVDQNPIGKSTRSNPATYLKAFDEIRQLFAAQQGAKQMGFGAGYFSFNAEGGRCEACKGEGTVTVEMQFMADLTLTCEECGGRRFKPDILDVRYRDKNIADVLDMTVAEAINFFAEDSDATAQRIVRRLTPLRDVGLGYIKLGQSSSTLSGGENQRVKLAYYLASDKPRPTMFIFDEPTTGLHFHDIRTLLDSFNRLIAHGHTVVIIEHNLDIIKAADYIIDIGPEGGEQGGGVVCTGTPEEVAKCEKSYTGKYLREKLLG